MDTSEIEALFRYKDFKKLNTQEIQALYRKLFSVYFYNKKDINHITLNMSKESAQNGFKIAEQISRIYFSSPNFDLFPVLKELSIPTLIVHGEQDIVPIKTAQEIKNTIPHAEIVNLKTCGHFSYIEKPKELFAAIELFLNCT